MKKNTTLLLFNLIVVLTLSLKNNYSFSQVNNPKQQIVLQAFWWDYWNTNYQNGWANYLTELAPRLKEMGIDAVWIPPTIKSQTQNGVGYSPFDHYDLGDKFQKGFLKTRIGDKDELLRMVAVMKANGIDVIQDIVLNHVTGAGTSTGLGGADATAMDDGSTQKFKNFRYVSYATPSTPDNATNYLARSGRFPKNWQNFYPNANNPCCTNDINSPFWGPDISYESDAFGLSGNATYNPAQSADYMRNNMRNWLIWYKKQVGWDGVRIDAIKHFPNYVAEDYLWNLQNNAGFASAGDDMFAVGEWVGGASELDAWANAVQNRAGTFDFSLRNAFTGIVGGNGNFDLSTVPGYQQSNRLRTVPFVNNHDTYRPVLDVNGNYIGWNTASQLGAQIEPADGRSSAVYAIALSVDGAPEVFFEDLFSLGYLNNRFTHQPTSETELPTNSDVQNLIWCHQNLHFKDGAYLVRWQAPDALVIERGGKALIGITDNWNTWQNLVGVQTSWADGTVLYDYSGAHGTGTATVYGGGRVDISIPPCNGTAAAGRKGYCVWAPQGIDTNYVRPSKRITQEWEMDNDLGDSHASSLVQGGKTPNVSTDCRVVGRIFADQNQIINLNLYPEDNTKSMTLVLLDKDCVPLDSVSGFGNLALNYTPSVSSWYTMRIRNTTATQAGQKCWVKAEYQAPAVVQTNVTKNKCTCQNTTTINDVEDLNDAKMLISPNPVTNAIFVTLNSPIVKNNSWKIYDINGREVQNGNAQFGAMTFEVNASELKNGIYYFEIFQNESFIRQRFVKL
ncbi:MAG: alpha-amylase family glycosyl hydrolase [Flavobacteriia bacterium]